MKTKSFKKIFLISVVIFVGFTIKAEAATGDITALRIHPMGWFAEIDIEGLGTTGTFDLGMGANNDPTNAKMTFTVTSQGYDNSGNTTTMTRTIYGTNYVRNIYPNEVTASTTDNTTYTTVRVALSEWIYSPDTATVNISSGFYTQGTANNAVTNLVVTNNSTESYPKTIANWSWPGYDRITGSTFKLRAVAFHRSAEQGKPVKAVKFTCTDQHSNTATDTVTTPSIDGTISDAIPVVEYIGTISTASLTQGDTLTCNFQAYPWYGDSNSVLNTGDGVNTMPTPLYAPQTYLLDKDNSYGVTVAVVDSVSGNNTTGAAVDYDSFDSQNPPAAFLNIYAAANAIAAYNNTNHSRNNTGAGIIYLKEGSHVWTGGTVTAGGQASAGTWTTVTKFPGTTRANVLISSASGTKQVGEKLKIEDVKITNSTTIGFTGMDVVWVHNSDVAPTGAASFYVNTVNYFTNSQFYYSAELSPYSTVNASRAIIRGNSSAATLNDAGRPHYTFIGNNFSSTAGGLTDTYAGQTVPTVSNEIYAFNKISYNGTTGVNCMSLHTTSSNSAGAAIIQNICENHKAGPGPVMLISADGSTSNPVNNILIWQNVLVGQRLNMAYNDYNLNNVGPAYRKNWSIKNNIFDDYNSVTDVDAHGGTPDNDRYGNHSIIHGVGQTGNIILNRVGTTGYENKFGGLYHKRDTSLDPAFVNDNSASTDATGNGDYNLTASSPAINLVASNQSLIPYDISGTARCDDGTGDAGAYEYGTCTSSSSGGGASRYYLILASPTLSLSPREATLNWKTQESTTYDLTWWNKETYVENKISSAEYNKKEFSYTMLNLTPDTWYSYSLYVKGYRDNETRLQGDFKTQKLIQISAPSQTASVALATQSLGGSVTALSDSAKAMPDKQNISVQPVFFLFAKAIKHMETSSYVKLLQIFLNKYPDTKISETGPGSPGQETEFFGAKTLSAVKKFQEKYASEILYPNNLTSGTGYVGPSTIKKINELFLKSNN